MTQSTLALFFYDSAAISTASSMKYIIRDRDGEIEEIEREDEMQTLTYSIARYHPMARTASNF